MEVFYVTGYFLREDGEVRPLSKYLAAFHRLAESGVQIGVYLDTSLRVVGNELENQYANVRILEYTNVEKEDGPFELPVRRNRQKDTAEYMWIMLMKLRLMAKAAVDDRIQQKVLAWIDFGFFHVVQDVQKTQDFLASYRFPNMHTKIRAPGCWPPGDYNLWDGIVWRYCGGVLIGRRELFVPAFAKQQALMRAGLPRLAWEVNYWSRMNDFEWYEAVHDESMLLNL